MPREATQRINPGSSQANASNVAPTALERRLVNQVLNIVGNPPVRVRLWNGESFGHSAPQATVTFHSRRALYRLLYKPTLRFGELYSEGEVSLDCDLVEALNVIYHGMIDLEREQDAITRLLAWGVAKRPSVNTPVRSRANIHKHYDLGNDFYALWLDANYNQYTCAYYPSPDATLEQAQAAKLELVCRKLALKARETVVEAGSGWGGLARYLARHHGVKVRSYNISKEQVAYARERAAKEGLSDLIEYVEDDYRNITGTYDAFVSIGMLEHVGLDNYAALGDVIDRVLKDDGRGLIHSIGQNSPRPLNEWIEKYIFPGAYPPSLREMMGIFEPHNFSVVDVENLRWHYAQTLIHWRGRFEANADKVRDMFDEHFVRMWYFYLSGSISGFSRGGLQLFQALFQRPQGSRLPVTRAHYFETSLTD
jgi:cyclopropane-fatty-acyl-phospholipid synthase